MAKLRRAPKTWRSTQALLIGLVIAAAALGALNLAPGLLHADLQHSTARVALRQQTGALGADLGTAAGSWAWCSSPHGG